MRNRTITRTQHLYAGVVLAMIALPYVLNNTTLGTSLGDGLFAYVLKGISWMIPAYVCWRLPRRRPKTKVRLRRMLNWMALMMGGFQVIFLVAAGLFDKRFGRSPYLFTPVGILANLILVSSTLLGTELARSYLVSIYSNRNAALPIVAVSVLFSFTSLPLHKLLSLQTDLKMVEYAGRTVLPTLGENTAASYLALIGGPMASIAYRGVLQAFHWFSPVLPDPGVLTSALVGTVIPLLGISVLHGLYLTEAREIKRHEKKQDSTFGWIASSVCSVLIVWFAVGIFPIYPSVVATGSMEPIIKPGDIILVRKIDSQCVQPGDVIQYRLDGNDITHRVISVQEGEARLYQMKGDANPVPDTKLVEPKQVRGRIVGRIPKVGWITLVVRGVKDTESRTY